MLRVLRAPTVGPFIALLLAMAFFSFKSDRFLDAQNLSLVLQQVMVVGVLAIGQTLVILTAGIDLSVGTVMALGQIVMTKLAIENGMSPFLAIALGILVCVAFGVLNGGLVTLVRLPAFIVTLGTLNIAFALTHIVSNDLTFSGLPERASLLRPDVHDRGRELHVRRRVHARAVRDRLVRADADRLGAPRLRGRRQPRGRAAGPGSTPNRVLLSVYTLAGLISGIAALLLVARTELGDPNAGQTTENLDSITAVVLGGTSLFGGRGTRDRDAHRRRDRRRVPQRADADRRRGHLPVPRHRDPRDPRRLRRSAHAPESGVSAPTPILEARGLVKRYGHVVALDGADFELYPGEILAIIGDNGAGKSTLIKALSGALQPDEGEISLDGERVHFRSPRDARRAGIETVYQDLAVAPALDIASNIFLGREMRRRGPLGSVLRMLNKGAMRREAARHFAELQIGIRSMAQPVENLSGGQRQGVAVARAATWARRRRDHGRADRRARRQGDTPGARSDPARARARPAGDPDQPRHAPRLRARRPDPDHAARQARGRRDARRLTRCRRRSRS